MMPGKRMCEDSSTVGTTRGRSGGRPVEMTVRPPLAVVTLRRAEKRNALSSAVLTGLAECIEELTAATPKVTAFVLRGDGPVFSAGADIQELNQPTAAGLEAYIELGHRVFSAIESGPLVAIAAMHGYVVGGGLELALACDMRVATADVKLGFPEIGLGGIPGWGGTIRCQELIGRGRAAELILTGRIIDGAVAHAWGLVNELAESENVDTVAWRLADEVAAKSRNAVRLAKAAVRAASPFRKDLQEFAELSANLAVMGDSARKGPLDRFGEAGGSRAS